MSRSAIGHSSGRQRPQALVNGSDEVAKLLPSSQWNGLAGSGFGVTPSDPLRTTAKPALRLVTVPGQRFTGGTYVGVMAFANDGGTLIGGIDRVRFHFEGRTLDVLEETPRTIIRRDGSTYICWAYWAQLRRQGGVTGDANLYIEAIPADATMQSRVIGPYLYSLESKAFGHELQVAPSLPEVAGQRYRSIGAALVYLRSQNAQSASVTITEAGTYDIASAGVSWNAKNWITIKASAPVTIAKETFAGDVASQLRPQVPRLHFQGPNITFDMRNISQVRPEANTEYWFDRVAFTNSANTRTALWRAGIRPVAFVSDGAPYFTECEYEFIADPCNLAQLARGNRVNKGYGDFTGDGHCIIYNTIDDFDPTFGDNGSPGWLQDVEALSVAYTGGESAATLSLIGGSDASNRTISATWGANSATFVVGSGEARFNMANAAGYDATSAGEGYYFQDVATWLNSLPDWSATLLDNTRRASSMSLPGLKGIGFEPQDVKNQTLSIVSCFDQHADFYQQRWDASSGNPTDENVIIAFNQTTNFRGQQVYLGPLYAEPVNDYAVICNAMHNKTSTSQYADYTFTFSAYRNPHSHVMTVHNSWVSQGFTLRAIETDPRDFYQNSLYDPDSYNLIANNVTRHFQWYLGVELDVDFVTGNHSQFTDNLVGADTSTGGDAVSLFTDPAAGEFQPAGILLANARARVFNRDLYGEAFKDVDVAGAVSSGELTVDAYTAPPAAISESEIVGVPKDGNTLSAEAIVTGASVTLLYQWQRNGANISGSTGKEIVLDEIAMGLLDGDTISCEIVASNPQGSDFAEPTTAYQTARTQWQLADFAVEIAGTGQGEIVSPNLARVRRTDGANAAALTLALDPGQYRLRATLSEWSGNGAAHLRIRTGSFPASAADVNADNGPTLYFAAGLVDTTFTFTSAATLILAPYANGRSAQLSTGSEPVLEKVA